MVAIVDLANFTDGEAEGADQACGAGGGEEAVAIRGELLDDGYGVVLVAVGDGEQETRRTGL